MKRTKWLALFAVLALVLAACSPSDDDATDTTADGGTATTADAGETPDTTEAPADGAMAGQGGDLLLLEWQAPTHLNPYTGTGTKDIQAAQLVIEPLLEYDTDGNLVPALATEVPTVANGGQSEDLTTLTYTLIPDVVWSDGTPFTSDDVVFTWEYCVGSDGCGSSSFTTVVSVEAPDDLTVVITFDSPTPWPYLPFTGATEPILQRGQFTACMGEAFVACEANLTPIGTGPFTVTEMRVDDTVTYAYNENYRLAAEGKPFFGTATIKGGGTAEDSARSVLETGEAHYGWNLQVPPEILAQMEAAGFGVVDVGFNTSVEAIRPNQTNPDGDPSSDYSGGANPNPFFFENADLIRALSMAISRDDIQVAAYGAAGIPTCNVWPVPGPALSTNNDYCLTQDMDGAKALLDEIGIVDTDGDGVRELADGTPLEWDYVTSTNQVRQDTQAIVERDWTELGIKVNMRNEDAGVFFDRASDLGIWKFFTDVQMYTNTATGSDAQGYFSTYLLEQIPESTNDWGGNNIPRCAREDFDATWLQLSTTGLEDPARNELIIELNDQFVEYCTIPLINRGSVSAFSNELEGYGKVNGWDGEFWNIEDWKLTS